VVWMLFRKIFGDKDNELEISQDGYT